MATQNSNTILITGCSSGIGLNAAQFLSSKGFHVVASVRQAKDLALLESFGLETIQLDLANSASIELAVSYINNHHPKLFGLVNNGAYGQPGAVEDLTRAALREQFETNFFGTHELTQKLMPLFHQQNQGRIVHVSSVLGVVALPLRGAYNASKFALEGLADTQRLELSDTNIKVSLIEPGAINTHFRANALHYFEKHIDENKSRFTTRYQTLRERLDRSENTRFSQQPTRVSKDIYHALTASKPKIRYRITIPTIVAIKLKRILTDRMMDKIINNSG